MSASSRIVPALIAFALVCFFFPFLDISCAGTRMAQKTGFQLLTGSELEQHDPFTGARKVQRMDSEPLVLVAFVLTLAASGLFQRSKQAAGVIAGLAAASLVLFKMRIDDETIRQGQGMIHVTYQFGFWGALIALTGAPVFAFLPDTALAGHSSPWPPAVQPQWQPVAAAFPPQPERQSPNLLVSQVPAHAPSPLRPPAPRTLPSPVAVPLATGLTPGRVTLAVEAGRNLGETFLLVEPQMTIGRADGAWRPHIDLEAQDSEYVHRQHARLHFADGNLYVTDLGGSNRTRVNNRPIEPNQPCRLGLRDRVTIGKVVLRVLDA